MKTKICIVVMLAGLIGLVGVGIYSGIDYLLIHADMTRAEYGIYNFESGRLLLSGLFALMTVFGWKGATKCD